MKHTAHILERKTVFTPFGQGRWNGLAPFYTWVLALSLFFTLPTQSHAYGLEDTLRFCTTAQSTAQAAQAFRANGYFPADITNPVIAQYLTDSTSIRREINRAELPAWRTTFFTQKYDALIKDKNKTYTVFWASITFDTIVVIHESDGAVVCDYIGNYSVFDAYMVANLLPIANVYEVPAGYSAIQENAIFADVPFFVQLWSFSDSLRQGLRSPSVIAQTSIRIKGT